MGHLWVANEFFVGILWGTNEILPSHRAYIYWPLAGHPGTISLLPYFGETRHLSIVTSLLLTKYSFVY